MCEQQHQQECDHCCSQLLEGQNEDNPPRAVAAAAAAEAAALVAGLAAAADVDQAGQQQQQCVRSAAPRSEVEAPPELLTQPESTNQAQCQGAEDTGTCWESPMYYCCLSQAKPWRRATFDAKDVLLNFDTQSMVLVSEPRHGQLTACDYDRLLVSKSLYSHELVVLLLLPQHVR